MCCDLLSDTELNVIEGNLKTGWGLQHGYGRRLLVTAKAARAKNAKLREALAALIDDVDALSALRDCDWEPHLDCAVDTADKYRALLEAKDG